MLWQRGEAYRLLASMFAQPLTGKAIEGLASVAREQEAEDSGVAGEMLELLAEPVDPFAWARRLAPEHARLFLGISEGYGPLPPYESVWREGRMLGECTVQVAGHYLAVGYDPEGSQSPCDHLAEELRFMAALCHAEQTAGGEDCAAQWRSRQLCFLDQHLMVWTGKYCRHIADVSTEPIYRTLARTTSALLAEDAVRLRAPAPEGYANA